ncbi:MAG: efflux RND transporter periplasmic adaptor subunit [Gemmatimonadaceae bacterium]|nr:efflux RND transporter periplasmic adaptor subunit [Gloeobacterales cyanobacterium ES-bin-141]
MTRELNDPRLIDTPVPGGRDDLPLKGSRFNWPKSGWLWTGPALLAVVIVGFSVSGSRESNTPPQVRILPVETMQVQPVSSYSTLRTYTGEVTTRRSSELGFERSGELVSILVDEGDRVRAGAPLATLDVRNLEAERRELFAERAQLAAQLKELQAGPRTQTIAAARASVRDLGEQLELARAKRSRREMLLSEGAISREQLDEISFETGALAARLAASQSNLDELLAGTRDERVEAQRASVARLDARLANLEVNIDKSTLKAPFAGTISTRRVDEGTVISAGQAVLRVVEDGVQEARIGLPVQVAVKPGSTQNIRIGPKTYTGRVTAQLPELSSPTRTVTVVVRLDGAPEISSGETARLELAETVPVSGYRLPTSALVPGVRGLWSAYVLAGGSKSTNGTYQVQRRDVEVLHTESEHVLVRGTLRPGERIVVSGAHRIVPGQQVRPTR